MGKWIYFISILIFFTGNVFAQLSKDISFSSYYDDNMYRTPEKTEDLINDFQIGLNFHPEDSGINLYYSGDLIFYRENSERNFSIHNLGFNFTVPFGDNQKQRFYLGTSLSTRVNGTDYSYYDYSQVYAYANFRFNLPFILLKTGYNFRYREYANIPDLTNSRHYFFAQMSKSFPTKTSLILEGDWGYKGFSGSETYYTTSSGDGMGGGRGGGMIPTTNISVSSTEIPSMSQVIILGRIAQSLHPRIGANLQYKKQISLTDETNYLNSDSYYQDEELFDDPFSYSSDELTSKITIIFPWAVKLGVSGNLITKEYISENAYVSAEDTVAAGGIREDDLQTVYVNLSKTFHANKSWLNALRISFDYVYTKNESNSYWYNYESNLYGIGIDWNF